MRLRKRLANGFSIGGIYTFSKSIDDASSIGAGATSVRAARTGRRRDVLPAGAAATASAGSGANQCRTESIRTCRPSADSQASTRPIDSLPTICGNCRSATTSVGSTAIRPGVRSSATGNGAAIGRSLRDCLSRRDLSAQPVRTVNGGTNGTLRPNLCRDNRSSYRIHRSREWFNTAAFAQPLPSRHLWRCAAQQHHWARQHVVRHGLHEGYPAEGVPRTGVPRAGHQHF